MEIIDRDAKCPMVKKTDVSMSFYLTFLQDRQPLTAADLFEKPPPMEFTQAPIARQETPEHCDGSSAKIDQLVQLLRLIPGDQKSLVFSQFTSFLDKVCVIPFSPDVL